MFFFIEYLGVAEEYVCVVAVEEGVVDPSVTL